MANDTVNMVRYVEMVPVRMARQYVGDEALRLILSTYDDAQAARMIVDAVDNELEKRGLDRFTEVNKAYVTEKMLLGLEELRRLLTLEVEHDTG